MHGEIFVFLMKLNFRYADDSIMCPLACLYTDLITYEQIEKERKRRTIQ
jgi:hypothetical protein